MAKYKDEAIATIREQVGDAKVICGLSGGVDSSVAAMLIHEAIGEQLTCVFVDTGLLRKDEATQVVDFIQAALSHSTGACKRGLFVPQQAGRRC